MKSKEFFAIGDKCITQINSLKSPITVYHVIKIGFVRAVDKKQDNTVNSIKFRTSNDTFFSWLRSSVSGFMMGCAPETIKTPHKLKQCIHTGIFGSAVVFG